MAVVYFNGFETGDLNQFVTSGSGLAVSTSFVRSGAYSLKCTPNAGTEFNVSAGINTPQAYLRFGLYIDSHSAPGADHGDPVFTWRDLASSALIGYVSLAARTNGTYDLTLVNSIGSTSSGTFAISAGSYHLCEFKVVISATVGILELKVDGSVALTLSGQNTGTSNVNQLNVVSLQTGSTDYDRYLDDLLIRNDAYPGNGKIIARQGKAGAPNADAWTKTAGQTAAQVWSETPFSAANEAHSTSASQAQTMLVADVGTGTDAIGASDTINACSTVAIMKEIGSGTTRTYSIRRRVSASNTDTAKTLTASDACYNDGIWTATRTALQSAEIGGVRGTGTGKHVQIEDCWLMVDYTPFVPGQPTIYYARQRVQ